MSSVLVAAGLVAGGLVGASTAQAAPSDCPTGYFCMWPEYEHRGTPQKYSWHKSDLGSFKNRDRSSYNRMSQAGMELYRQTGYVGYIACSRPGSIWTHHSPALDTESVYKVSSC
ncbi:peptidase inhibitor family I36 protein [Streptomyces sp. NPDC101145]|uniref:peptidase inhibitor family I36 protein n=1 Tax=Streptomyces sp. NPDC101145 TaxID=3366112 RepID=UPI00380F8151